MNVQQYFESEKIDLSFLEEVQEFKGGKYWEGCLNFVTEKWNEDLESLSDKQAKWLGMILDDAIEFRIGRKK